MKLSRYNYFIEKNGYTYWFNGITQKHFRIRNSINEKLLKITDLPQILKKQFPNFYKKLIKNGFLINEKL